MAPFSSARDAELNPLYDKLFWGNNFPAVTPEGEHFTPVWSEEEVAALEGVLREGLELLVRLRRDAV